MSLKKIDKKYQFSPAFCNTDVEANLLLKENVA